MGHEKGSFRILPVIAAPFVLVIAGLALVVFGIIDFVVSLTERKNHTKEVKQS